MDDDKSPHVRLALAAIEAYVREGRVIDIPPETPKELLEVRAAAFVSLKKHGELRGCIGTLEPMHENLAKEIIMNAISAATRDPRFLPVRPSELPELECSVDVLSTAEPVCNVRELDPKVHGVIVECGPRRGVLLPDLDGVDTVEEQLDICRRKACIACGEPVDIYCFTVTRCH